MIKVNKYELLNYPKCVSVQVWWESSKRFERYINFSEILPISPLVILKMRSRSLKSALKLVQMVHLCKSEENPSIGLKDIYLTYKTMTLKIGSMSLKP